MANDAVENLHGACCVDDDSISAGALTVDQQPVKGNIVRGAGIDLDTIPARHLYPCKPVALDANRLTDGERAVAGRINHVDLAVGGNHVVGALERPTGMRERAWMRVITGSRDKNTGLRARRRRRQDCECHRYARQKCVDAS